ncbi:hypothetical protein C8F01DRAFT_1079465 [Mycena amicta]|nr:hypothetical protein C8F01DRAFT_1079465 [Mycena amicta]
MPMEVEATLVGKTLALALDEQLVEFLQNASNEICRVGKEAHENSSLLGDVRAELDLQDKFFESVAGSIGGSEVTTLVVVNGGTVSVKFLRAANNFWRGHVSARSRNKGLDTAAAAAQLSSGTAQLGKRRRMSRDGVSVELLPISERLNGSTPAHNATLRNDAGSSATMDDEGSGNIEEGIDTYHHDVLRKLLAFAYPHSGTRRHPLTILQTARPHTSLSREPLVPLADHGETVPGSRIWSLAQCIVQMAACSSGAHTTSVGREYEHKRAIGCLFPTIRCLFPTIDRPSTHAYTFPSVYPAVLRPEIRQAKTTNSRSSSNAIAKPTYHISTMTKAPRHQAEGQWMLLLGLEAECSDGAVAEYLPSSSRSSFQIPASPSLVARFGPTFRHISPSSASDAPCIFPRLTFLLCYVVDSPRAYCHPHHRQLRHSLLHLQAPRNTSECVECKEDEKVVVVVKWVPEAGDGRSTSTHGTLVSAHSKLEAASATGKPTADGFKHLS